MTIEAVSIIAEVTEQVILYSGKSELSLQIKLTKKDVTGA